MYSRDLVINSDRFLRKALRVVMLCNLKIAIHGVALLCRLGIQVAEHIEGGYVARIIFYNRFVLRDRRPDLALRNVPLRISHCFRFIETHFVSETGKLRGR
jgi:hypothetical protein